MLSLGNCCSNGNSIEFEIWKADGSGASNASVLTSQQPLPIGQWFHLTASYDYVTDGTSIMKLYLDGQEVASRSNAYGPVQGNQQPLDIGRYYWSSGYARYLQGRLDELRVFDTALTTNEIQAEYIGQ